jgi:hypothetical protein
MADSDSSGSTGRMLVALTAVAVSVMLLGVAVVWALSYGPLG